MAGRRPLDVGQRHLDASCNLRLSVAGAAFDAQNERCRRGAILAPSGKARSACRGHCRNASGGPLTALYFCFASPRGPNQAAAARGPRLATLPRYARWRVVLPEQVKIPALVMVSDLSGSANTAACLPGETR